MNDPLECPAKLQENSLAEIIHERKPQILSFVQAKNENDFNPIKNHLMFSHYADAHKGICLLYKLDNDFMAQDMMYAQVNYVEDDTTPENFGDLFAMKHTDWEYENERRFVKFGGNNQVSLQDKGKIIKVFFGYQCPKADKKLIIECLKTRDHTIEFYNTIVKPETLSLDFVKLKNCSYNYNTKEETTK